MTIETTGVGCNISGVLRNIVLIGKNVRFSSRHLAFERRHLAFGSRKAGAVFSNGSVMTIETTGVGFNISGVLRNIVLIGKNVSFSSRKAGVEASNEDSERRHLVFGSRKAGVKCVCATIQKLKVFIDGIRDNSTVVLDVFSNLLREICCINKRSKCAGYCYCQKGLNQCLLHLRNP